MNNQPGNILTVLEDCSGDAGMIVQQAPWQSQSSNRSLTKQRSPESSGELSLQTSLTEQGHPGGFLALFISQVTIIIPWD